MQVRPLSIDYTDANVNKKKEFLLFCNSLRCPLCGSQLDGNVHPKRSLLYCVHNNEEYKVEWVLGEDTPKSEVINFWYPQYQYKISSTKNSLGTFDTLINRYNMDAAPQFRERTAVKVFEYTGERLEFFRYRMDEEKFLKKLKIYNILS